ncbi:MAG: glyoxalase [Amycolatopsis sp.]|jgi:hypothetical protein|nr:glyoxalase [Amycolatopsis sp.]
MVTKPLVVGLPTADRRTSFAFYRDGLGLAPFGDEVGDDGLPEPLQFTVNDGVRNSPKAGELLDRVPRRLHPRLRRQLADGRPPGQPGGPADRRGLQHRPDPSDQPEFRAPDPVAVVACGPELPARGHHRRGEREADRGPVADPARAVLGRRPAGVGGRDAVRRPGAHDQRRAVAEVLRIQAGHHLAQRGQRPGVGDRDDGGARTSPAPTCPNSPPAGTGRWRRSRGTR